MKSQTVLAFDYGEKFIGVAVGSTQSGLAQALTTVNATKKGPDWAEITSLIAEWEPDCLVVGLPLNMDGTESELTRAARRFVDRLKGRYNLPVHMVDERLTTIAAKAMLTDSGRSGKRQHKPDIDKLAAQAILQSFFEDRSRSLP